ncbi:hormogonium polysaccharide secretion pseudopilin HpsB [Anabaena azotica]|uniref:Type II secretion system protein n=1 Tax=Anabaena azotica FACHB-119 TaxID=947527 RepID=A0ABR8D109_9NOST|nr:hormogonium polysaccharide secretion pseudopilin HpsB [Anabaena azotica]MBD2500874.1 type II secretion system protein [Anabaena azotica FACHB-119]
MKTHKLAKLFTQSNESGFSIVESLVAIIIASILLTAIAPVLVISAATRVQARRTELAAQAARTYVDGLQTGTISPIPASTTTSIHQFDVPTTGSLTCSTNNAYCAVPATPANSLYCIDGSGDGACTINNSQDFVVQAFRKEATGLTNSNSYQLGIRVYRADAFQGNDALKRNSPNKVTATTYTGGLGDRKAPLFEMTTEINPTQPSFKDLCSRLGGCQ